MSVKLIEKIRHRTGLKNYGIQKALRAVGCDITTQGIDSYERETARSMRLDVLVGLKEVSGLNWEQLGKLLSEEFGKKKRD